MKRRRLQTVWGSLAATRQHRSGRLSNLLAVSGAVGGDAEGLSLLDKLIHLRQAHGHQDAVHVIFHLRALDGMEAGIDFGNCCGCHVVESRLVPRAREWVDAMGTATLSGKKVERLAPPKPNEHQNDNMNSLNEGRCMGCMGICIVYKSGKLDGQDTLSIGQGVY